MDEELKQALSSEEFAQYLVKLSGAKNKQELEQFVQKLGKEGIIEEYKKFVKSRPQIARRGAKLDFLSHLVNLRCKEGEELKYFKVGGKFCKKCVQKERMEREGALPYRPIEAKGGTKVVRDFKEQMLANKCGGKTKKPKKKENGGLVDFDKCGKKVKKNK